MSVVNFHTNVVYFSYTGRDIEHENKRVGR